MQDGYGPNSRSSGQLGSIMGACLSDHDLRVLVEGSASDDEVSAWKAHIGPCDSCGARLAIGKGMMDIREAASDKLRLDASGRLDEDIACRKCGYNLRGLNKDGACPECGTAVGRSTQGDLLRFCDPT